MVTSFNFKIWTWSLEAKTSRVCDRRPAVRANPNLTTVFFVAGLNNHPNLKYSTIPSLYNLCLNNNKLIFCNLDAYITVFWFAAHDVRHRCRGVSAGVELLLVQWVQRDRPRSGTGVCFQRKSAITLWGRECEWHPRSSGWTAYEEELNHLPFTGINFKFMLSTSGFVWILGL